MTERSAISGALGMAGYATIADPSLPADAAVLNGTRDADAALATMTRMRSESPSMPMVLLCRASEPFVFRRAQQLRNVVVLYAPMDTDQLLGALDRLTSRVPLIEPQRRSKR